MSTNQREAAVTKLLGLVTNAFEWASTPSRRLKMWSEVPSHARPACFLFEGGSEAHTNTTTPIGRRMIEVRLFIYIDCSDLQMIGATQLNAIADALDAAMTPTGSDVVCGRNTLGGTAYWARIDGATLKVPGDLDGDGIMVVPIKITLP